MILWFLSLYQAGMWSLIAVGFAAVGLQVVLTIRNYRRHARGYEQLREQYRQLEVESDERWAYIVAFAFDTARERERFEDFRKRWGVQ